MDKGRDGDGGIALGRLVLALDQTLATLVSSPRGLDTPVSTLAMVDMDDIRYGLSRSSRSADLFLLVGLADDVGVDWLGGLGAHRPVAVLTKQPTPALIGLAERLGIAVIAIDPHARWERIYNVVTRVLDGARATTGDGESMESGSTGDLFELAGEVARRTGGLVSIEDEHAHVLAYSSAGEEADELRRLSILGREGPPEMLAWLREWGVMDAVRTSSGVVMVDARADLGVRPRRAVAIRPARTHEGGPAGDLLGVIWLQEGSRPPARDTDEVLVGAAAVAARVISRRRSAGSEHDDQVRRLLGVGGEPVDTHHLAAQLGIAPSATVTVVGFTAPDGVRAGQVSALTLHASAFSPLSVTVTIGDRAYVVLPGVALDDAVTWARVSVDAADRLFTVRSRAVVAGPDNIATATDLRRSIDRVLDAADTEADLIDDVTTVERSRTGVLLGEIIGLLSENPDLVDSRVTGLADLDARGGSEFTASLQAYLDHFGDVRAAAAALHVHPNTLRYRIRRVQTLTGMDLDDPATRLVVALSLRVRRVPGLPRG